MESIYIQELINGLKKLEIAKEKLDLQIKEYEKDIKNFMQSYHLEEIYGANGERITYKEILGRRFDTREFKKHFEELYNSYLRNTKNLRFKFNY
jgi:predicted phage-related endonuclease